jgi:hypothetical protein
MSMKKLTLLIIISSLLFGCDHGDDVHPDNSPEIFKLIIDGSYNTGGSGDWLIVHDQTGKLIYSSRFETGDTLVVRSSVAPTAEKLSITLFATFATAVRTFALQSYTDINIGDQWVLRSPVPDLLYPQTEGSFTMTALNIPPYNNLRASTRYGASANFEAQPQIPYSFKGKFARYNDAPQLVSLRDNKDNLRYRFFDDIKLNEEISFSYDDLTVPETIIEVDVFGYDDIFLNVRGTESNATANLWGYEVSGAYWDSQRSTINIGYVDRLKYYKTTLTLLQNSHELVYEKTGGVPESITFPKKVEVNFNNMNAVDFSANLSVPFQRRISQWYYQPQDSPNTITWTVDSPSNQQKLQPLPKELTDLFPTLHIDRVTHGNTKYILAGSSYEELIDTRFKGKEAVAESEVYSASFW